MKLVSCNYIFYKHLSKYNHLSHPNGRRNQTKSIARMNLKLKRRKEKKENERKREGVGERGGGGVSEREKDRERAMLENVEEMIVHVYNSFFLPK